MSQTLMVASAVVIGLLGALHLVLTFRGPKLSPRDPSLQIRMSEVAPVISRETTMWRAWLGFNVSHSLGALLFALVYGYLALIEPRVLFGSWFLLLVGAMLLGTYLIVARAYWFRTPFTGIAVALVLFIASVVLARV